ncbi:metalloprotease TldD [Ferrimonas aestuarii]|uniref:Metalloprotease TldD n=1 Tax=Ferrimonas aestuarii TaxID=2569539 RepID=A0A4V5NZH6_9GAMM|nr:metalloprotease TldD [Ferrimonas aestuarii]TKB55976.1 metalloprotease TldD [Ferrimonas aestuarii]
MTLKTVSNSLLAPQGLEQHHLHETLGRIHQHKLDYSDIYLQSARHESWVLEDGIVKEGSFNIEQGVGIRAIDGEKTGFAYADEITLDALLQSADAARGIAASGGEGRVKALSAVSATERYGALDPIGSWEQQQKLSLLQEMDAYARSLDSRVTQVVASLSAVYEEVLVAASDGTLASDIRPLVRLNCSVIMVDGDRRERGSAGMGGRYDYAQLDVTDDQDRRKALQLCQQAVKMAEVNLRAVDAPAGEMPVVLGAGWPGVLLHEAVGHGLEGDFNRKGSSAFAGRIGEKVASELCTVVDDGTLSGRRGSITIDDEGTPAQNTMLIENGILKGYMQDKLNARLMGMAPTGNGRRESYAHMPMPRMTNTYMLGGEHCPEEIIASVKQGIYAPNFGGGQVDITSGKFVFSASEAYLIENGKLTTPVKGATLIGNGPEAMQTISMVGNDLSLDQGVGVCGKEGQSVPVGVGQPTLKLDRLTVGGTE